MALLTRGRRGDVRVGATVVLIQQSFRRRRKARSRVRRRWRLMALWPVWLAAAKRREKEEEQKEMGWIDMLVFVVLR